jgi:hypothetical protein
MLEAARAARIVEGLLTAALIVLTLGRFCIGSYMFHVLKQRLWIAPPATAAVCPISGDKTP